MLAQPTALAYDRAGNTYVSELGGRIRRIDAATGAVTLLAGRGGEGDSGDGGPATAAALNRPHGLLARTDGTVVFCDTFNNRLRAVAADGTISAFARGFVQPVDVSEAVDGTIYVADFGNRRIARVSASGAVATVVSAVGPQSVWAAEDGFVYFTELGSSHVSRVQPATGRVELVDPGTTAISSGLASLSTGSFTGDESSSSTLPSAFTCSAWSRFPVPFGRNDVARASTTKSVLPAGSIPIAHGFAPRSSASVCRCFGERRSSPRSNADTVPLPAFAV